MVASVDPAGENCSELFYITMLTNHKSVDNTHGRHRHPRQPREQRHQRRGSSLDRATSKYQENVPMQATDVDYLDSKPMPARELSRKHVRVVRQDRLSDATVVRGGEKTDDRTEPKKRVRISEQWGTRTPTRSWSR
jgi:hypothetical protein